MNRLAPVALAIGLLAACGYHISGHGDLLPKTLKTVAVQPFGNSTPKYKLARLIPADISRELISRTKYQLVDDPAQADAVLSGSLVNFVAYSTLIDAKTSRATAAQVIAVINVTLTERATGKVLFTRSGYEFRQRYEISLDPAAYFDESGTAIERVSKDVARTVVSAILEAF